MVIISCIYSQNDSYANSFKSISCVKHLFSTRY
nr:MAG TPA: hypothetical protein [Bacteriophage sp.]